MSQQDTIYSKALPSVGDFRFDEHVVEVFPDMINRSVPGYATIIQTLPQLAERYSQDNTNVYDLGCSLGAATLALRKGCEKHRGNHIIAVDNSQPMIDRAQLHLNGFKSDIAVEFNCQDVQQTPIDNASIVVLNFTLQFVPKEDRNALIDKIYSGLNPGGVLLIAEKVAHPDAHIHDTLVDLHHDFKRANGYSELEISQKRAAIENVMKIDTLDTHFARFKQSGFAHAGVWLQCFNFAAMLAVKGE
ncbi:MAG: tRNA (cmo5U34)-methyltransferase [Idiomarina sp. T82-3]|jgi:tRNA (cmo5U34)-methyltransferase|uniref:carboxy-S-adenosyl-L-methionine synthase CmoA n=1 Tax=Idiomarina TaxID=135575 RepID=UPI000792ED41|nr:carboxy-S-adenosyl-L-methionine synthase CmoA [Idiomarina sp. T82-3]KXS35281.1 MAG: tRNA (cmo5U34)-methyltransferase [Idiomarina sp. T82-3]